MQELNELKNLVMQNLEKNGYLSNIRAQIRASVFKTIDGQESNKKVSPFYSENTKVQKIAETPEGQNNLQLIKELMQVYGMEYSLNIFSSESNLKDPAKRQVLELKNNLQNVNPKKALLLEMLQKYMKTGGKKKGEKQKKQGKPQKQQKQQKNVELPVQKLKSNQSQGQIEEDIIRNQSRRFGQSQQFGQSQGYDITVDSLKLEEYDYYEQIN